MRWFMALRIVALWLALALLPHAAAAASLATLQIEIWPEYDRPRALVILKGELAKGMSASADVSLRIPASAGIPSAVAFADASGKLFNLAYTQEAAGSFTRLRFRPPQGNFHLEFYDVLAADSAQREYRYTWLGDLAVERLSLLVKEPAASSNLAVSPPLELAGVSPDGLVHRAADLGARREGQALPIEVRYTKSDPRSSTEIAAAPAAAPPAARAPSQSAWWLALIGAGVVGLLGAIGMFIWRPRRVAASAPVCRKCDRVTKAGDRFCANCGAALG